MKSLLIFVVALYHLALARGDMETFPEGELRNIAQEVLFRGLELPEPVPQSTCQCKGYVCECCKDIDFLIIDKGCVRLTYLTKEFGIAVSVSVNGVKVAEKKISARKNPAPICVEKKDTAKGCVYISDLNVSQQGLSGCIKIKFTLFNIFKKEKSLGCFQMNFPSSYGLTNEDLIA